MHAKIAKFCRKPQFSECQNELYLPVATKINAFKLALVASFLNLKFNI